MPQLLLGQMEISEVLSVVPALLPLTATKGC